MSKRAQEGERVDMYASARSQFDGVTQWLEGSRCPAGHAELEDGLGERMQELARRLFQGRLDKLFLEEQSRILKDGGRPAKCVCKLDSSRHALVASACGAMDFGAMAPRSFRSTGDFACPGTSTRMGCVSALPRKCERNPSPIRLTESTARPPVTSRNDRPRN